MKTRHQIIPLLLLGGALAGGLIVGQQAGGRAENQDLKRQYDVMKSIDETAVSQELEQRLPKWSHEIVSPRDGARWSAKLSFEAVTNAVGDEPLKGDVPRGAMRIVEGDRVLRLIPQVGKVRYVHRGRKWKPGQSAMQVDDRQAMAIVSKALVGLGVPRMEMANAWVDTQMGVDSGIVGPVDSHNHEMYRLVTVSRKIGGLPVLGSRARVAVNGSGAIQRLRLNWAPFHLPPGLESRAREAVLTDLKAHIMRQNPKEFPNIRGDDQTQFQTLNVYLAYAPMEMTRRYRSKASGDDSETIGPQQMDDDNKTPDGPVSFQLVRKGMQAVRYVPVAVASVYAAPTPYQVIVPLAQIK